MKLDPAKFGASCYDVIPSDFFAVLYNIAHVGHAGSKGTV